MNTSIIDYLRAIRRLKNRPRRDRMLGEGFQLTVFFTALMPVSILYATGKTLRHESGMWCNWAYATIATAFCVACWVLLLRSWYRELKPLVHFVTKESRK